MIWRKQLYRYMIKLESFDRGKTFGFGAAKLGTMAFDITTLNWTVLIMALGVNYTQPNIVISVAFMLLHWVPIVTVMLIIVILICIVLGVLKP